MYLWPPTLDASSIFTLSKSIAARQAQRTFAVTLLSHLKRHGFARVRNHGMPPATIAGLFRFHDNFFGLPLSQKLAVRYNGGENPARGYSPLGFENTAKMRPEYHAASVYASDTPNTSTSNLQSLPLMKRFLKLSEETAPKPSPDSREIFTVGPPEDTAFPTPFPGDDTLPNFKSFMNTFFDELRLICSKMIDTIEVGLSAPTNSIRGPTGEAGGTEIVMNFYPSVQRDMLQDEGNVGGVDSTQDESGTRRIWPHTDGSIITALVQDGVGATGLEFEVRKDSSNLPDEGQKADDLEPAFAPLSLDEPGDIVLLVSDTLERWTNGYLRAAVHRVGLPSAMRAEASSSETWLPARRTAIMLLRAPPSADLGALAPFVTAQNPALYENMTAEEFLKQINRRNYGGRPD